MEQQKESSAKIKLILQIQQNTISKRQETKAGREKETKKKEAEADGQNSDNKTEINEC